MTTALTATDHDAEVDRRAKLFFDALGEVERRGGETKIEGRYQTQYLALEDEDRAAGMVLFHAAGLRQYSRRFGARWATLSYLYGVDDNGPWAVRVPGTITTVHDALAWITPKAVSKAIAAGLRVKRQGDVYAVETTPAKDGTWDDSADADVFAAHRWNPATRRLVHIPADGRKHRPLQVTYPVRFVPQRVYAMGRNGGRANGD